MKDFIIPDSDAMHAAGVALGRVARAGDVIGLVGGLGAGKTCFCAGLAEGLGLAPRVVTSPTFTLIHEHHGGRVTFHHADLYRLETERELHAIGLDEIIRNGDSVVAIEWIDKFPALVRPADDVLVVEFTILSAGERRLELQPRGERAIELAEAWSAGM